MKAHLRRCAWIYGTLLVLIAWPIELVRLQRIPPFDKSTLLALAQWTDREAQRAYGPPLAARFNEVMKQNPMLVYGASGGVNPVGGINSDPDFIMLSDAWNLGVPSLAPEAQSLGAQIDPALRALAELNGQGGNYTLLEPQIRKALDAGRRPSNPADFQNLVNSFLNLQTAMRLERQCAIIELRAGRWREGFARLSTAATWSDAPTQGGGLISVLIQTACRAMIASGFEAALVSDPDPARDRAALAALQALHRHEPRLQLINLLMEKESSLLSASSAGNNITNDSFLFLMSACFKTAKNRDQLHNPALRRWAERFYAQYARFSPGQQNQPELSMPQHGGLRWTTLPAAVRFMRRAVASEPAALDVNVFASQDLQGLDRWTVALLGANPLASRGIWEEGALRARVAITKERLAEVAFAARLANAEHGAWPARLEDLAPSYLPADSFDPKVEDQPNPVLKTPTGPFLPYRMGWLTVDEGVRRMLWANQSWLRMLGTSAATFWSNPPAPLPGNQGIDWISEDAAHIALPIVAVAFAEELQAHPRLVKDAQAFYRMQKDAPWQPLDAAAARRLTDEMTADLGILYPDKAGRFSDPSLRIQTIRDVYRVWNPRPLRGLPQAVRVTATLQAPERALAVWSPGPDGKDDGGRMTYDPTNGTTSAGDLIVFPEGY